MKDPTFAGTDGFKPDFAVNESCQVQMPAITMMPKLAKRINELFATPETADRIFVFRNRECILFHFFKVSWIDYSK
jgi:hypothetical protein